MPISQSRFEALADIIEDPEVAAQLSLAELNQAYDEITEYKNRIASETKKLEDQGLSSEDIARVDAARTDAPDPDDGTNIPLAFNVVSPRTADALAEGATRVPEGVIDLSMDLAVELGDIDVPGAPTSEDRTAWKQQVADRRTQNIVQNMQEFGQLPPEWAIMAGEIAPWLAALPAQAGSFLGLLATRTMQGGVMGGSFVQKDGEGILDRAFEVSVGAGLGLVTATPEAIVGHWKQKIAGDITRSFNVNARHTDKIADDVREMTGRGDFGFSTAQAGGGRFALGLEIKAANRLTKDQQNRNLDILSHNLLKTARALWNQGSGALGTKITPGKVARELRETLKTARKGIYKKAADDWTLAHRTLLTKYGDDVVVDGRGFLGKLDEVVAQQSDILVSTGARPSKNLMRYRKDIDIMVNPMSAKKNAKGEWQLFDRQTKSWHTLTGTRAEVEAQALQTNLAFGGLDVDQTNRVLMGLVNLTGGESVIFNKASPRANTSIGRALMGDFTSSLKTDPKNAAAVADITAMRAGYAKQMQRAQAIDDLVVTQIFGGKQMPRNPGRRLDRVLDQDAEDLAATRDFLEEWNYPLLNELRATHMNRIVRKSRNAANPDVDTTIDLPKLIKALENTYGGVGQAGRGLYEASTQADLLRTARALRIISNKYFKGISGSSTSGYIEDFSINLLSRSPEFMARFVARVATGSGGLEQKLLDQTFRQSIQTIAEKPLGTRASKAAMVVLNEIFHKAERQREAEAEQAEKEFKRAAERARLADGPMTVQ